MHKATTKYLKYAVRDAVQLYCKCSFQLYCLASHQPVLSDNLNLKQTQNAVVCLTDYQTYAEYMLV